MNRIVKTTSLLILFLVIIPSMAGLAVMALWNSIIVAACGFAAITFIQAVGLFIFGQILSGGVILGLFMLGGGIHAITHHHGKFRRMHAHWHNMTDEQRREFIEGRLADFHSRTKAKSSTKDETE